MRYTFACLLLNLCDVLKRVLFSGSIDKICNTIWSQLGIWTQGRSRYQVLKSQFYTPKKNEQRVYGPENGWLEHDISFWGTAYLQEFVSFREGMFLNWTQVANTNLRERGALFFWGDAHKTGPWCYDHPVWQLDELKLQLLGEFKSNKPARNRWMSFQWTSVVHVSFSDKDLW